jgi:hypothetical protein
VAIPAVPTSADVDRLQQAVGYPAVSLLCSMTSSSTGLRRAVTALAREAVRRLADELGATHPVTRRLSASLDEQVAAVTVSDAPAVGVFVSPTTATWCSITEPVADRVVVDTTFATRDLVHAQLRSTRTWILHLNERATRLYDGRGRRYVEHRGTGLPVLPTGDDRPNRRGHRDRVSSRRAEREMARFVRSIDDAFGPVLSAHPRPLLVVGPERRVAAFAAGSRHRAAIDGTIQWGGRHLSTAELEKLTAPLVDDVIAEQTKRAFAELGVAAGTDRLASGLADGWRAAWQHRVHLLVVEHGYAQAVTLDALTGRFEPVDDRDEPGVVDDLVDELIERVLAQGGRVAIVADGTLDAHQRVAAVLRS